EIAANALWPEPGPPHQFYLNRMDASRLEASFGRQQSRHRMAARLTVHRLADVGQPAPFGVHPPARSHIGGQRIPQANVARQTLRTALRVPAAQPYQVDAVRQTLASQRREVDQLGTHRLETIHRVGKVTVEDLVVGHRNPQWPMWRRPRPPFPLVRKRSGTAGQPQETLQTNLLLELIPQSFDVVPLAFGQLT